MNYKTLKKAILEEISGKELWINEIHKRMILKGFDCSTPTVSKAIKELEKEGLIETKKIGKTVLVRERKWY